jgi:hypothetical protein
MMSDSTILVGRLVISTGAASSGPHAGLSQAALYEFRHVASTRELISGFVAPGDCRQS